MQSSRRKRERVENDDDDGAAMSRAPRPLKQSKESGGVAAEVTPQGVETMTTATTSRRAQQGTADTTTEGTNGGNEHSSAGATESSAMDTSNDAAASSVMAGHDGTSQGTGTETRQKQIADLISHRTILLERMKQCKTAAASRLKQNAETKGGGGQSSSDSEDIEKYREICKKAIDVTRKQRTQPNDGERRSSVSLRRGSSVGQRMNAALSSLAPSTSASASLALGVANTAILPTAISGNISAVAVGAGGQVTMPNSKQAALPVAQHLVQPMIQSVPANSNASLVPTSQKYGGGQQNQTRRSASTSRAGPATLSQQPSSAQPLHVGTAAAGLPFNRLAHPSVNFPETRALREKRDVIRTKLNALIHERLERIQQTTNADKTDTTEASLKPFPAATEKPSVEEYRLALPRMVLERGVNSPSRLPRRRKTHWDYLLEEMRWLATDFVEERKWKAASARTLASAVVSNRLNAVAPIDSLDGGSGNVNSKVEEDSPPEKANDVANQQPEVEAEMTAEVLEKMGVRNYSRPDSSDTKLVQSVARIVSNMVTEVWTGTIDSGLLAATDEPLIAALARHKKLRLAIEDQEESVGFRIDASDEPSSSRAVGSEENKENGATASLLKVSKPSFEAYQGENGKKNISASPLLNDDIDKQIDALHDYVKNRSARKNRKKQTKVPLSLGIEQRKAADFVEFLWECDNSVAPCLNGTPSTGKTVLSCSLLWKRRSEGPQLVICSPTRLIRWAYEVEKLPDLNVYVFGRHCGLSSAIPEAKARSKFQPGDVIICEFASLIDKKQGGVNLDLPDFCTVVLDVRFPAAAVIATTSKGEGGDRIKLGELLIPPELVSHLWWAALLNSLHGNTQRLMLDNSECFFLKQDDGLDRAGLSERQRLDTLAAMVAFVVGPALFRCQEARSVQHKVVSWAKHSTKDGNARKRPAYGEVRGVLADTACPFRYTISSSYETGQEAGTNKGDWVARLCALSASQRSAYEDCCVGVRGAVAFGSITDYSDCQQRPEPYEHAVQGLMKLRRVCLHSHLEEVLRKYFGGGFPCDSSKSLVSGITVGSSVSQPDADIATEILSGSAKLRELLAILNEECGLGVAEDCVIVNAELGNEAKRKKNTSRKKTPRKKVAVLSVLPEVQLLTSILLNAMGIQNEILGFPLLAERHHSSSRLERNLLSSIAWIGSQLSLLRFSSSDGGCDSSSIGTSTSSSRRSECHVVIASPLLVAVDNGGLGIEAADVVVCVDENWSGRDASLLEQIRRKCCFAHEMNSSENNKKNVGCSFIRLVCEKTCEHVFLSDVAENVWPNEAWPTDERGLLTFPSCPVHVDIPSVGKDYKVSDDIVGGRFRFPGTNILRFRGNSLSSVLLPSKPIPPKFATGDPVCFLPYQECGKKVSGISGLSVELVRSLMAEEDRSMQDLTQEYWLRSDDVINRLQNSFMVPPFAADFPGAVISRHDMVLVPSRLYLDHFGRHLVQQGGATIHDDSTSHRLSVGRNSIISGDHGNLVDAWHKSGLSCKPGDMVPSLLSYSSADATVGPSSNDGRAGDSGLPRSNVFSATYSSSRNVVSNFVRDGNQGFEPLAYFPPLFPGLMTASEQAQTDIAHPGFYHAGLGNSAVGLSFAPSALHGLDHESQKRKEAVVAFPMAVASKRPRLDKSSTAVQTPSSTTGPFQGSNETDDRHLSMVNPTIVTEDEASQWDQSSVFFDFGEDYGHLGVGALSGDSTRDAATVSVDVLSYSKWTDPYEADGLDREIFSSTISCDAEEFEAYVRGEVDDSFLDTMLLFVAKRAPTRFSGMPAPFGSQQIGGLKFSGANSAWVQSTAMAASAAFAASDANAVNVAGVNRKRKSQTQESTHIGGYNAANQAYPGASLHSSKSRESYRSKRLASFLARQGGGRPSLFQVPSFLLASIRIRDDVLRRALSHSQAPSGHPPYVISRSWMRACYKLNSSAGQTGDSALLVSKRQQIKMATSPAPVDFGPFVAGYISPSYRVCSALPHGAVAGITLPMGVKLPRRPTERKMQSWVSNEDKKLKESVLRYGLNWHLVATAVNSFDYEEMERKSTMENAAVPFPCRQFRSPRQCRERWNHLVELDPDLADKLGDVERARQGAVTKPNREKIASDPVRRVDMKVFSNIASVDETNDAVSMILPSSFFVDKDGDEDMLAKKQTCGGGDSTKPRGKKSFAALRRAAKNIVEVNLPILGSVSGEKPTMVVSHPSHATVIQAAIANTPGGKADMWPLQILDGLDKQRSSRNVSVPGSGRQNSPNRQSRPHISFQVPQAAMTSPSRNSQQGYPQVSVNGGSVPRGQSSHGNAPRPAN